ncbi:putative nicotinamide N-methyase [Caulobacter sp. BE264]|uniref:class I SAM-dependent methyltransferase n=1 Tax=Caulobacter sp. BE264 TaxID=2817724 RepID=UPI00285C60C4|nr:50S ribosomal protein L11 methyltransferase [Caulobacter sp. BE264]MDR7228976.1 putative nicotinamide N-methyase [Caulobacter sp. BE264]
MDLDAFIRERLPLEPAPGVSEVRLHCAGPRSGLSRLAEADADFGSPYWARPWGGGLVLARHVLDKPQTVTGRRVLDLGAGSGLVAIAAALAGAADVMAVDVDPCAVAAARLNAQANGVAVRCLRTDLLEGEPPEVDLVLVGDLFYAPDLATRTEAFLRRCRAAGLMVLIGDPWRAPLPIKRLRVLARHAVTDYGDPSGASREAAVFELI